MFILKKERLKKQWTLQYVATIIKTTKQSIYDWENGRSFPRYEKLTALESLFNLTHQELFATDPDENPSL